MSGKKCVREEDGMEILQWVMEKGEFGWPELGWEDKWAYRNVKLVEDEDVPIAEAWGALPEGGVRRRRRLEELRS